MTRSISALLLVGLLAVSIKMDIKTVDAARLQEAPTMTFDFNPNILDIHIFDASPSVAYEEFASGGGWGPASGIPGAPQNNSFASNVIQLMPSIQFNNSDFVTGSSGHIFCNDWSNPGWRQLGTSNFSTRLDAGASAVLSDTETRFLLLAPRSSDGHVMALLGTYPGPCANSAMADTNGVSNYSAALFLESTLPGVNSDSFRAFVTGGDGGIYSNLYTLGPNTWSGWVGLGSLGGHTSVESLGASVWHDANGQMIHENVFWRGNNDALWNMYSTDGVHWSAPGSLGGVLRSGPGCIGYNDNSILCAAIGQNGHIWRIGWTPNGWGSWTDDGTPY